MLNFCTLFDSNYLDKGLVLYRSLKECCKDFTLYIFCFDDKAASVLKRIGLQNAVIIKEEEILTSRLKEIKGERTKGEYCWTCSSVVTAFVLDNYNVDNCTYLDCDLYFYKDPQILINEMPADKHVIIVPHRHGQTLREQFIEKRYGRYCVQFNYFDNSIGSRKLLKWWEESCLNWCYQRVEPGRYGDQKYLDQFARRYKGVHELTNLGGGVAPWNSRQYNIVHADNKNILLEERKSKKRFDLIFYHFQSIDFIGNDIVNLFSGTKDAEFIKIIYYPYLRQIFKAREELDQYGVSFPTRFVRSKNVFKLIYKKLILLVGDTDYVRISEITNSPPLSK